MKNLIVMISAFALVACANKSFEIADKELNKEGSVPIFIGQGSGTDRYPLPNDVDAELASFAVKLPEKQQIIDDNSQKFYEAGLTVDGNKVTLLRIDQSLEAVWNGVLSGLTGQGFKVESHDRSVNEIIISHPSWNEGDDASWWRTQALVLDFVTVSGATQISFWDQFDKVADTEKTQLAISAIDKIFKLNLEP